MRTIPSIKMDKEILGAVSRLKGNTDFNKLTKHLEERYMGKLKLSVTPDDVACRWQQGGAKELEELLRNIDTCEGQLEKLNVPEGGKEEPYPFD